VERWNAGDLPGFVDTYWDGPELTFLGSGGLVRGRQDLLANYRRGYPDAGARGVLSFEVLEFRPLGSDHALLLGRYRLDRDQPAGGVFSLVLARAGGQLAIVHDHTSADAGAR
jgi:beta-aspartyl-peptidase (threonine type)